MEATTQGYSAEEKPTGRRWARMGGGCATLLLLLLVGGTAWWQYVSYVPVIPPPQVMLPVPNARDDFLAAIQLIPSDSSAQIRELYGPGGKESVRFPVATPRLRQILVGAKPALQRLRVGLSREFGMPPVVSFTQPFPELAQYRQLARLLAAESELALREGRTEDALRSGLDAVKMGEMIQKGAPLIHGLVGVAVGAVGLRSVENAIDLANADTSARAARELAALDAAAPTSGDALVSERNAGLSSFSAIFRKANPQEAIHSLYQLSDQPSRAETLKMAFQLGMTPKRKILANYRTYLDADIERGRKPYYAQGPPPVIPLDPLSAILVPVYEDSRFAWAKQQALRRVILTRLAVRAYTLREGHAPAALRDLVPKYLPSLPEDPFAPKPLVYRVDEGKAVLYSRGPDGDDDGGRDIGSRIQADSDGDLASTRRIETR